MYFGVLYLTRLGWLKYFVFIRNAGCCTYFVVRIGVCFVLVICVSLSLETPKGVTRSAGTYSTVQLGVSFDCRAIHAGYRVSWFCGMKIMVHYYCNERLTSTK